MRKFLFLTILCTAAISVFAQEQDSIKKYNLDEVIIQATRSDIKMKNIPQKIEVVTGEVIQQTPANTMADLLKTTTNLDILQYPGFNSSIGLRGYAPKGAFNSYTLILINGKPMGTFNISTLDKNMIERVEVVKGPYSSVYGANAMGGVINIVTKKTCQKSKASAELSYGGFNSLKMAANANIRLGERSSFMLGFVQNRQERDYRIGTNNFLGLSNVGRAIIDDNSYGDRMRNSTWLYNQANARYNHQFNKAWELDMEFIYFDANDIKLPGNYWGSYGQNKKDVNRSNLYFDLNRRSEFNTLKIAAYNTSENSLDYSSNAEDAYANLKKYTKTYGFKVQDDIRLLDNLNLLVGGDFDIFSSASERFQAQGELTTPYNPDNSNMSGAVFAQLGYNNEHLNVNLGLRNTYVKNEIEKNDSILAPKASTTLNVLTPSFGAQYKTQGFKVHTSYGSGFSLPDAFKTAGYYQTFYLVAGNPDLKPETASTIDFGLGYQTPNGAVNLDLTYFDTRFKDKIIGTILDSLEINDEIRYNVSSFKNANKANMSGFELMTSVNIGRLMNSKSDFEIYSNMTFMINNTIEEELTSASGVDSLATKDMLYTRGINGNFGVKYRGVSGFNARLNARYIGHRLENDWYNSSWGVVRPMDESYYYNKVGYTTADQILQHPDHLVFDLYLGFDTKKYSVGINASNLFDENYAEKDGYNMPGRSVMANVKYNF